MTRKLNETTRAFFDAVYRSQVVKAYYLAGFKKLSLGHVDDQNRTPLVCAAAADFSGLSVKLAARGGDLNHVDKDGVSALGHAVSHSDIDLVEALLKNGADPNTLGPSLPLPLIATQKPDMMGPLALFKLFLAHPRQDIDRRDAATGDTALTHALRHKNFSFASLLLNAGARVDVAASDGLRPDLVPDLPETLTAEIRTTQKKHLTAMTEAIRQGSRVTATRKIRWRHAGS